MTKLYIIAGIVIVLAIGVGVLTSFLEKGDGKKEKAKYRYTRKQYFLTRAERECYEALASAVGAEYLIFAQVQLSTLVDNKVKGQDWRAAFRHISQKSVDFVLCDKKDISSRLAIELDDKSHDRYDRQERDIEVERILEEAGVPLLRLENRGRFDPVDLLKKIKDKVGTAT